MIYSNKFPSALILLFCFFLSPVFSQNTFQRAYGADDMWISGGYVLAADGGYVLSASVQDGTANYRPALMKVNQTGTILWMKKYGNGNTGEGFAQVIEANDGGFLAVGTSNGTNTQWNSAILIVKTDADGNLEWEKILPDYLTNRKNGGNAVVAVPNGYIISGHSKKNYTHTVLVRIDNQGEPVWSKRYATGTIDNIHLTVGYVSGDTIFASGRRDSIATFSMFNATTGAPISNILFDNPAVSDEDLSYMTTASNGDLLLAGLVSSSAGRFIWVCRIDRTGALKWSKTYPGTFIGRIVPMAGDHFLLVTNINYGAHNNDPVLIKIKGDGEVIWSYEYGLTGYDGFDSAVETPDGGVLAIGNVDPDEDNQSQILLVKTDVNGLVTGCCRQPFNAVAVPFPVVQSPQTLNEFAFDNPLGTDMIEEYDTLLWTDFCPIPVVTQNVAINFCLGDSVIIGGTVYTQPGTVTQTVPSVSGDCDTLVTYTLEYTVPSVPSSATMQCPTDIMVFVPSGTTSTPVSFAVPVFQSDCECPGGNLAQTQGLSSGSAFPMGLSTVCYEAQDFCGTQTSCCFHINVVEDAQEDPCDVKNNGCVKFELLRISRDAQNRKTYQIRVQNNCSQSLTYAAFQLPAGIIADGPQNGTYTAPSGRSYTVRNPNNAPMHSIRFSAQGTGIQGGESDLFEYTLPPQSTPTFINALVKLSGLPALETHLNTFNCPIDLDASNSNRGVVATSSVETISISPNPVEKTLVVDLQAWSSVATQVRVFNVQGQLQLMQKTEATDRLVLNLDLPAGVYLLEATTLDGAQREVKRFVVR